MVFLFKIITAISLHFGVITLIFACENFVRGGFISFLLDKMFAGKRYRMFITHGRNDHETDTYAKCEGAKERKMTHAFFCVL